MWRFGDPRSAKKRNYHPLHFPGIDRIDILFLRIPLLLPTVLLTASSAVGIHIASGTEKAAHLWHTWPQLRIDFVSGLAKGETEQGPQPCQLLSFHVGLLILWILSVVEHRIDSGVPEN